MFVALELVLKAELNWFAGNSLLRNGLRSNSRSVTVGAVVLTVIVGIPPCGLPIRSKSFKNLVVRKGANCGSLVASGMPAGTPWSQFDKQTSVHFPPGTLWNPTNI